MTIAFADEGCGHGIGDSLQTVFMPMPLALFQDFAVSLTTSFASSHPARPEEQLKLAVKSLLETVGAQLGHNTLLRSESPIEGGRPDFAVDVVGVPCCDIELRNSEMLKRVDIHRIW